jgi:8-oxo-dGTP pyrophosphatase MutT (NUDIX family)
VVREIFEETGLEIVPITPLEPFNTYLIEDGEKAGTTYEAFCCKAIVTGGALQLRSDEHVDYAHQLPRVMAQSPGFRADTPLAISKLF